MGDGGERIEARGVASLRVTQGGATTEVNAPLGISVDESCRWSGWPEHEPAESVSPEVRRFLRKGLHAMRRPPTPRPVRPVPKPASTRAKRGRGVPAVLPCPACNGEGWFGDHALTGATPCPICDGAGIATTEQARRWVEGGE